MDDIPFIPLDTIDIHWKAISYTHPHARALFPRVCIKRVYFQLKDARWGLGGSRLWD